ncbi:MAG TPA: DUF2934 domain-containing protein [Candidatus Cryosericum sp.]|nr:DUF2934 domain-containing protein [Candidatus Cryosericum sp.]
MLEKGKKSTRRKAGSGPAAPHGPAPQSAAIQGIAPEGTPIVSTTRAVSQPEERTSARPFAISSEERRRMIAEAAYYRALRRSVGEGSPDRDWIEAEAEIDALLLNRR